MRARGAGGGRVGLCVVFLIHVFAMGLFFDGPTALVLRVLYRLRTLSEQAPFDAATFSFAFFLLGCVARKGGVGVGVDKGGEQDGDEALEQVALVLDVIKFHRSECTSILLLCARSRVAPLTHHLVSDVAFPRKMTLEHVLHVVRTQPRLSKDASSLLIDLGEAIQASATREEVAVLIEGTLLQETHVRNSCLQALQVRLRVSSRSPFLTIGLADDRETVV